MPLVFDPPRQGAEAQARELAKSAVAGRRRGVVQSGDVRARRAIAARWRLSVDGRSRRSISSAIPPMSRSWRD